ncbi:hypothetical protein HK105_202931 [Polyrhizophydium stewartii]|uniref:S-formylglutathione hydrolase n=1 Tax=Polyrhizophydium stewartii TaxID=2732419 RepID=A0ABR4NDW4_9FUNG
MLTQISAAACHGGTVLKLAHASPLLGCDMKLSVFLPAGAALRPSDAAVDAAARLPTLLFLSGLTCNEDNFITKACAVRTAARLGLVLVCPDTSPRGLGIAGEDDSWDFGTGAGFYVDATEPKWARYQMFSYITRELPALLQAQLPVDPLRMSIFGHSMGGHGALVCALRNPGTFKSVSAFAPISNPINCPWGHKAFGGYLGTDNKDAWKAYDATELTRGYSGPEVPVLVDQGAEDSFLKNGQLLPDNLVAAAASNPRMHLEYRLHKDYDHSYWFIQTFIDDHLEFHHKHLTA